MAASKPNGASPTDSPMGAVQNQSSSAPAHVTLPVPSSINATRKPNIPDVDDLEYKRSRTMRLVERLHPSTIQEALDETDYYVQVELGYNFKDPLDLRYDGLSLLISGKLTRARDQIEPTSRRGRIMLNIGIVKNYPIKDLLNRIARQLLTGVAEHIGEADLIGRCAYQLQTPYTLEITEKALYNGPPGIKRQIEYPGIWYLTLVEAAPKADGTYDTVAGGRWMSHEERDRLEMAEAQCWFCKGILAGPFKGWVMKICGKCEQPTIPQLLENTLSQQLVTARMAQQLVQT